MAFDIRDHVAKLEPAGKPNKFMCPACGGNDLSFNENDGSYNCWNDASDRHRAEIRNVLSPMKRWERPPRQAASYKFPYRNRDGRDVLVVSRDDTSGKKIIRQEYPTVAPDTPQRKAQIGELRATVLPYRYQEAIDASKAKKSPVFIVEGELCCDKLWEIGVPAVTFLGGSGQYRANGDYTTLFRGCRVVLCPDRDEPGIALMKEVAADNPGAQFLYAEPDSFEWENLPQNGGYDVGDWIDDGADEELILRSIVAKDRHEGKDGKPSYEEIIATLERMVGLYGNDNSARIAYETQEWLNSHGIKMPGNVVDKILNEARTRITGKEEMEVLDAKRIALSGDTRKWTIAGILPESSVMLLAAAPGTGKSTMLYNWALHVATGRPWSNRRCQKGKVLIIQCDEPVVDAAEKLDIIGFGEDELDFDNVGFVETWRFDKVPQLLERIKKDRPQLIVIDSLTSCLAGMDVDLIRSDAGNCIYELRDIANQYGCSIVILHHLNKSGGIRDSSSFEANVSEVVKLYKPDNNPDPHQFMLEWVKSRSGLAGKHFLQRDDASYGWTYLGPINGGNQEMDKLVNALNNRAFERFTRSEAARAVGSFDTGTTGRLLEQARRQGLITSSWDTADDRRNRLYQSWDYEEVDITNAFEEQESSDNKQEDFDLF
nr:unnamed protein product [uncultured Mediterranean phage uvMED]